MDPSAAVFLDRLSAGSIRYIIPVYQRMYAWGEEHCRQLWNDIVSIGRAGGGHHFTGSLVWVQNGGIGGDGDVTALLIDGQQRMTTLSLLLLALADYAKAHDGIAPDGSELEFFSEDICQDFLLHNKRTQDASRYKLTLSEEDNATFHSLIEVALDPSHPRIESARRIIDNYEFFKAQLATFGDPNLVWRGIRKLQVISVSLSPGEDNPQLIFESMNSTGKDLAAADLVRNFVLMGLPVQDQNRLYQNYLRQIELNLGHDTYDECFDEFLQDYLTVRNAPETINLKDVYPVFKRMCVSESIDDNSQIEELLGEMLTFSRYYACIALGSEQDPCRHRLLGNLAKLGISVVNPLLMFFYSTMDDGRLDGKDCNRCIELLESYLLRRSVCACQTNSLNKFFPSIIARLDTLEGGDSLYDALVALLEAERGTARRFPDDSEFAVELSNKNMYAFKKALYLLNRLENSYHAKTPIDFLTGTYTIEHVMPQNALAHPEWITMLGGIDSAQQTFDELLHNLGNLTVTAYNSELSDGLFNEKRERMVGGFINDAISLSADMAQLKIWNKEAILARRDKLVHRALVTWAKPEVNQHLLERFSKRQGTRKANTLKHLNLRTLFDRGIIVAGEHLFHNGTDSVITATITETGTIKLSNGEEAKSPSVAAIRSQQLATGSITSRNGWNYWHVLRNEQKVKLDDLRRIFAGENNSELDYGSTEALRIDFWSGFYEYASEMQDFCDAFGDLSLRAACPHYYCDLTHNAPNRHISLQVYTRKTVQGVRVEEWFDTADCYKDFLNHRTEIESIISQNEEVFWDKLDTPKKSRIVYIHRTVDVSNPLTWEDAYAWFVKKSWLFKRAFTA